MKTNLIFCLFFTVLFLSCKKNETNLPANYSHFDETNFKLIPNINFHFQTSALVSDGGLVVAGTKEEGVAILKLNPENDFEWQIELDSTEFGNASDIVENKNGDFTLVGRTLSTAVIRTDGLISRIDKDGNEIWRKIFGQNRDDEIWSIIESENEDLFLTGSEGINGSFLSKMIVQRLNSNGDSIQKMYIDPPQNGILYDIIDNEDDGFAIVGQTNHVNGIPELYSFSLNQQLEVDWSRNFVNVNQNFFPSKIIRSKSGGFFILGNSDFGENSSDILVVKINEEGEEQWRKKYGGENQEWSNSIVESADDNLFIFGSTESYGGGLTDWLLLKVDTDGNEIWTKTFGGENFDSPSDMELADDEITLVGNSGTSPVLLKLDLEGQP